MHRPRGTHRDNRRRAWADGSREPRRARRGCGLGRVQHRAPARAGPQPVPRHRPSLPPLLRSQGHVRALRVCVRDRARRLRHPRRDVRGADADPDGDDPPLPGDPARQRRVGRFGELAAGDGARGRQDRRTRSRAAVLRERARGRGAADRARARAHAPRERLQNAAPRGTAGTVSRR